MIESGASKPTAADFAFLAFENIDNEYLIERIQPMRIGVRTAYRRPIANILKKYSQSRAEHAVIKVPRPEVKGNQLKMQIT